MFEVFCTAGVSPVGFRLHLYILVQDGKSLGGGLVKDIIKDMGHGRHPCSRYSTAQPESPQPASAFTSEGSEYSLKQLNHNDAAMRMKGQQVRHGPDSRSHGMEVTHRLLAYA
jgi:hypothetical protein